MPTVSAGSVELYYEVRGTGPPALLIMGATGDAGHLAPVAEALADEFTALTYDRRGNSPSPPPAGWRATSVDEQADDAAALLGALGLAPAAVFGTSIGGVGHGGFLAPRRGRRGLGRPRAGRARADDGQRRDLLRDGAGAVRRLAPTMPPCGRSRCRSSCSSARRACRSSPRSSPGWSAPWGPRWGPPRAPTRPTSTAPASWRGRSAPSSGGSPRAPSRRPHGRGPPPWRRIARRRRGGRPRRARCPRDESR